MDVSMTAGYQAAEYTGAEAGFQGCFSDPATLQQFYFVSSLNSPNLCAENCAMKGYSLSGVTQGSAYRHFVLQASADDAIDKCMCGANVPKNLVPTSTCNVACAGK